MRLSAHDQRLAKRIWGRHPSRPCRFLFSDEHGPGLFVEAVTEQGTAAYGALRARFKEEAPEDAAVFSGALVVDGHDFVFVGPNLDASFLARLARWVRDGIRDNPALAGLVGSGVATAPLQLKDSAAIAALDPAALTVHRDPALWEEVVDGTAGASAAILAEALPGERLWAWIWVEAPPGMPTLVVQPVAWDPNRDRIDGIAAGLPVRADDQTLSALAIPTADGRIQILAAGATRAHLRAIAEWVQDEVSDHPGLARLRDCELAVMEGGRVAAVIREPAAWAGVPTLAAPATRDEAARVLAGLGAGDEAWFWLTGQGDGGPFFTLRARAGDEEAEVFGERVAQLYRRFPRASGDAVGGTLVRLADGSVVLATSDADVAAVRPAVQALGADPAFAVLARARLVRLRDGVVVSAQNLG